MLLLGGSHSEIPLITAATRLGFEVVTTGNRDKDLGHQVSNRYINGDFSDPEEMLRIAEEIEATAVCSGCNDFAAISASSVVKSLGLGGHDSPQLTRQIHTKDEFYRMASTFGLPIPASIQVESPMDAVEAALAIGFPVIIKPVDLTGGKGVGVASNETDVVDACRHAMDASRQYRVVVQKFLRGTHHAISSLIVKRKVVFFFVDNEHYYTNKHLVGGASYPSTISQVTQELIRDSVEQFASRAGLSDGLLHLQFIHTAENEFLFIDVCRRSPGDLYIRFVELATGFPYPEAIVRFESGLPPLTDWSGGVQGKFVGRLCLMPERNGVFLGVTDLPGPGRVIEKFPLLQSGEDIYNYQVQKVAILQIEFDSMTEMLSVMNAPENRFSIRIA